MRNTGLEEAQDGINTVGEISITSGMQMIPPLDREQRGTKELLDESERRQRKSSLKTQH